MKNLLIITLSLALYSISHSCQAQHDSGNLEWHTDMNKAMKISKKEKKPLMLFFTGSDWCGWCIKLQKEVFFTPKFEKWAKDNVVLVELDFPRRKKLPEELKQQNASLQQTFQVRGYPTVYFVMAEKNADGNVNLNSLGKTGYVRGGPDTWIQNANTFLKK